ncbi:hypothetical protein G6F70_009012 [Rhizopus microsporus]|nr:hypothetical protein G6F71_005221 [Rhizopus microsporus]KAG1193778.1 hypothetical protein G6F70_009012 [Rhizopus microsporus]KAG1206211.1 hypothetical protein G6F69_008994 [Rhizopus microsporus]KAG1234169.1 hypothetical protein G6F67_003712 [Rhizopus microsporus]KAG1258021.1 hypothetical protein G6F68_009002 [Rhizopus microsporus]
MDIIPEDVSLTGPSVGLPLRGLICNIREYEEFDSLCVLELPPISTVDQRFFKELDHFLRTAVSGSFLEHDTAHHDAQLTVHSLISIGSPTDPTALFSPPPRRFGKRRLSLSHQEVFPLVDASVEHLFYSRPKAKITKLEV